MRFNHRLLALFLAFTSILSVTAFFRQLRRGFLGSGIFMLPMPQTRTRV